MPPSVELVAALAIAAGVILWQVYKFVRKQNTGSIIHRIPGPPAPSFWTGNVGELNQRDGMAFHERIATQYGSVVKLNGFAGRPLLYVRDPKALHSILIKEEPIYQESPEFIANNMIYFGPGLLSTLGHAHSKQRKIMNPVFSVNHMRYMAPLFFDIGRKLREAIAERLADGPRDIDVMDWMGRIALELIGQGGLGYSFDPLVRDTKDAYAEAINDFTPLLASLSMFRKVVPPTVQLLPRSLLRVLVSVFPVQTRVSQLRRVVGTMYARAGDIYTDKRRAFAKGDAEVVQQVQGGKDILSILMRANSALDEKDRLTEEEVVAQMTTLIFAANDTTSNTLSRIFHLLAQHPDVQSRLRQELLDAHAAEGMDYDELNRLPVLDSVCRETLRRYAPVNLLLREAVADTVLPLGEPVEMRDGSKLTEIPIPKGTELLMGFLGCNVNKNMWGDDALEWIPDRWLKGVPEAVTEARIPGVYSNIMSFSGGKRACIGFKFSEMEMKVVLSVLVSTFVIAPSEKPVCWNMGGPVTFPTVGWESIKPGMYLKLSLYDPADKQGPRAEA